MINKINLRFASALFALISIFTVSLPTNIAAQKEVKQILASDLQKAVAVIEEKTEARRKELGIPGIGLAIVKDGEIIFMKGFGYKDFEKKISVTADSFQNDEYESRYGRGRHLC